MLKDILRWQMNRARKVTEGLIDSLSTPEDWIHQVHPAANHPLWITGHLSLADNFFSAGAGPGTLPCPGWLERVVLVRDSPRSGPLALPGARYRTGLLPGAT